jgi:hypothetical protein
VTIFRQGFAVILLAALLAAPCFSVCAGWAMSPNDRMACCAGKTQGEADGCCASGEGRQNAEVPGALLIAALPAPEPVALKTATVIPLPHARFDLDLHDPHTSDSERHILLSVFLI